MGCRHTVCVVFFQRSGPWIYLTENNTVGIPHLLCILAPQKLYFLKLVPSSIQNVFLTCSLRRSSQVLHVSSYQVLSRSFKGILCYLQSVFLLVVVVVLVFLVKTSLCIFDCPATQSVDQVGFDYIEICLLLPRECWD